MKQSRSMVPFHASMETEWNRFVDESANGTFLFHRRFMEYHKDRFQDASLVILEDDTIVALLPASVSGAAVSSHGGLTYGGLIWGKTRVSAESIYVTLSQVCDYWRAQGITAFTYKAVPQMYHLYPNEADLHALYRLNAKLCRRDLSSAFSPDQKMELRKGRKAMVQRAKSIPGLQVSQSNDWQRFHALLLQRLDEKYGVLPVHSASELAMLAGYFPNNIKLIASTLHDEMVAGCVLFETGRVVHSQYLATNEVARETGAMDLLLSATIQAAQENKKWFDFGISTTNAGLDLNAALASYKEGFGAKSVLYDWYKIDF